MVGDRVPNVTSEIIVRLANECGFELAGIAPIELPADYARYRDWLDKGYAGRMTYLADDRAERRRSASDVLPEARSVICVGKLYNTRPDISDPAISRYAWGDDYHRLVRGRLDTLVACLKEIEAFEYRICCDATPLLERSLARAAGLGWIGKNTCLINEPLGSWFFLGEIVTTLELQPGIPPPDRCGTCTKCIDACPTQAIVPAHSDAMDDTWTVDARRCISYLTVELHGAIPEEFHDAVGHRVFGCDVCQEVCPWNSRAPISPDPAFRPRAVPPLETLARVSPTEFRRTFEGSPVLRTRYDGMRRNARVVLKNTAKSAPKP